MAESSGSAEVGALASGSFLFFMGKKSHSERRFFPLSIERLNTIKQGERRKKGPSASTVFLRGAGRCRGGTWCSGSHGKAWLRGGRPALPAGWLARRGGLEGDRDKAWILVTRLIKDLFQP